MTGFTGNPKFTPAGIVHKASYQMPCPEGVSMSQWMMYGPRFEGGPEIMMAHIRAVQEAAE